MTFATKEIIKKTKKNYSLLIEKLTEIDLKRPCTTNFTPSFSTQSTSSSSSSKISSSYSHTFADSLSSSFLIFIDLFSTFFSPFFSSFSTIFFSSIFSSFENSQIQTKKELNTERKKQRKKITFTNKNDQINISIKKINIIGSENYNEINKINKIKIIKFLDISTISFSIIQKFKSKNFSNLLLSDLFDDFILIFFELNCSIKEFGSLERENTENTENTGNKDYMGIKERKFNLQTVSTKAAERTSFLEFQTKATDRGSSDGVTDRQTPWFVLNYILEGDGQTDNLSSNNKNNYNNHEIDNSDEENNNDTDSNNNNNNNNDSKNNNNDNNNNDNNNNNNNYYY